MSTANLSAPLLQLSCRQQNLLVHWQIAAGRAPAIREVRGVLRSVRQIYSEVSFGTLFGQTVSFEVATRKLKLTFALALPNYDPEVLG